MFGKEKGGKKEFGEVKIKKDSTSETTSSKAQKELKETKVLVQEIKLEDGTKIEGKIPTETSAGNDENVIQSNESELNDLD